MSAPTPGTPGYLRVLNDQAAIALLLEHGPMSRNELARLSGLSKPTAAEMLRRLEAVGLVREAGERTGNRGPNAVLYELSTDRFRAVAVDIEGPIVRSAVVDVTGELFPVVTYRMSASDLNAPAVEMLTTAISRACDAAKCDDQEIVAIAVGLQAAVDHRADSLTFLDDMPGWPRHGVRELLSKQLGLHVLLENDANLAAVAERAIGAGRLVGSFALLWLADGVGVALDVDGTVFAGDAGAAGEIGYLHSGDTTIGELVSSDAIRLLRSQIDADPTAHGSGDSAVEREFASRIGRALLPVLAVTDPAVVILQGPSSVQGGAGLAAATQRWLRDNTRWVPTIVPPAVSKNPVLTGAISRLRLHLLAEMQAAVTPRVLTQPPNPTHPRTEEV